MPCMSPSKYPALFAVKSEPWRSRKWKKRQRQRRGEKLAAAPFNDQKYEAARARKEAAQASRNDPHTLPTLRCNVQLPQGTRRFTEPPVMIALSTKLNKFPDFR